MGLKDRDGPAASDVGRDGRAARPARTQECLGEKRVAEGNPGSTRPPMPPPPMPPPPPPCTTQGNHPGEGVSPGPRSCRFRAPVQDLGRPQKSAQPCRILGRAGSCPARSVSSDPLAGTTPKPLRPAPQPARWHLPPPLGPQGTLSTPPDMGEQRDREHRPSPAAGLGASGVSPASPRQGIAASAPGSSRSRAALPRHRLDGHSPRHHHPGGEKGCQHGCGDGGRGGVGQTLSPSPPAVFGAPGGGPAPSAGCASSQAGVWGRALGTGSAGPGAALCPLRRGTETHPPAGFQPHREAATWGFAPPLPSGKQE